MRHIQAIFPNALELLYTIKQYYSLIRVLRRAWLGLTPIINPFISMNEIFEIVLDNSFDWFTTTYINR